MIGGPVQDASRRRAGPRSPAGGPTGRRSLLGLGLAALVTVGLAVAAWRDRPPPVPAEAGGPVLPALAAATDAAAGDAAAAVARIVVADAGGETVIRRGALGWVLPGLHGYRADPAVIDRVAGQLAALERAVPLTRLPERFPLLGLGAVAEGLADGPADGAARARVTLHAADGAVLGDLVIGRVAQGGPGEGVYVRRSTVRSPGPAPVPAEDRAWRAAGPLDLPRAALDWADREVLALAPERLARLTVARAGDPERLAIVPAGSARNGADAEGNPVGNFRLEDPPPDRVVERAFRVDAVAETVADLRLIAVRPAAFLADQPVWSQAQATTADGLVVTLTQRRDPADPAAPWLTVDAGAAPGAAPEIAAEAAALTARTAGWAYRLPAPEADRLAATAADLTAPRGAAGGSE